MVHAWIFSIVILLISCACGSHKESKTKETSLLDQARIKGEQIYAGITEDIYIARCDKLTFKALLSVYKEQDLDGFEKPSGKWHRDVEPCYPESSRSSISFDGVLSVLHHTVSTNDRALLDRLIDFGNDVGWVLGEGPREYTDMHLLIPLIYSIKHNVLLLSDPMNIKDILSGFRGHLLASYIWMSLRIDGELNELEFKALEELINANPEDPMYLALYHRATDGNQEKAIKILLSAVDFEGEGIYSKDGVFGWGSTPASVYYLVTLSIIEGK